MKNKDEDRDTPLSKSQQKLREIAESYRPLSSSLSDESQSDDLIHPDSDDSVEDTSPQLLKKVTRTFNMGIRVILPDDDDEDDEETGGKDQNQDQDHYEVAHQRRSMEKKANDIIFDMQTRLGERITIDVIDATVSLVSDVRKEKGTNYSNKFVSSALGKIIKEKKLGAGLNDNPGQAVYPVLVSAVSGMLDRQDKIQDFLDLFDSYPEEATTWLVIGRNPFLENKVAKALNVKFDFARNLVMSSRRIVDLVLSPDIQLRAPLPSVTLDELTTGTGSFITSKLLALDEQVKVKVNVNDNLEGNDNTPVPLTQRQKSFKRNLSTLQPYQDDVASFLYDAVLEWNNPTPTSPNSRWGLLKQTAKKLSEYLNEELSKNNIKKKRGSFTSYQFNSILRGILMTALLPYYSNTTSNSWTVIGLKDLGIIRADKLVSKPFMKKIMNKTPIRFPLPLNMGPKYMITRPGNKKELTALVKKFGKFPIHIRPLKEKKRTNENKNKNISKKNNRNRNKNKKKIPIQDVFVEVIISKKVQEFIRNGAKIRIMRITSGDAPAHKIIVSLVLSGSYKTFLSKKFINSADKMLPDTVPLPIDALGIDLNRPSKYVVAFSEDAVTLPPILEKLSNRYNEREKTIVSLQKKYDALTNHTEDRVNINNNSPLVGPVTAGLDIKRSVIKLRGEISRVHRRRTRLLKELHRVVGQTVSTMLVQSRSLILCVEDLDVNPRGKRGALAKAILSMPDEPDLVKRACLVSEHTTNRPVRLIPVNPSYTSSGDHNGCEKNPPGKILRNSRSYDIVTCSECNKRINTHVNAAKVVKRRGLEILSASASPS